ncbi:MAG: DUF1592 domain-containing protein, partial [Gemmataceae bacterium]|nr:DUF1592 domain-containing protein [Gemmataceae bacterium]
MSPLLLATYAEAADFALSQAVAQTSKPPEVYKHRFYPTDQHDLCNVIGHGDGVILTKEGKHDASRFPIPTTSAYGGKYKGLHEALDGGAFKEPATVGLFRNIDISFQCRFRFAPIHTGRYKMALSTWSFWWDKGKISPSPRMQAAGIYIGGRLLGHWDAPSMKPTRHEFTEWLNPDGYMKFNTASIWNVRVNERKGLAGAHVGPAVAVDYIDVEGPIWEEWPPPSHKALFGELPVVGYDKLAKDEPRPARVEPRQLPGDALNQPGKMHWGTVQSRTPAADAEKLLGEFLPRAFRRGVSKREVARYAAVAVKRLAAGECFEEAMKAAYKTALCSPDFLFLDGSTASRLSYFLWNSTPDDELMKADLKDAAALRKQTERMLKDEKAARFVADFADQWLDQREFDLTSPDGNLYPEWQPYLADAVRREPAEYLKALIAGNEPASETVRSGRVIVNQRLAEHYGITGVEGTRFRNVGVDKSLRGGFLTQAAILKVTANGTTTSPVKRGAWVMRKVLGRPPLPP